MLQRKMRASTLARIHKLLFTCTTPADVVLNARLALVHPRSQKPRCADQSSSQQQKRRRLRCGAHWHAVTRCAPNPAAAIPDVLNVDDALPRLVIAAGKAVRGN